MRKEDIDNLLSNTFDHFKLSTIDTQIAIDAILFLVFWDYTSMRKRIDSRWTMIAFANSRGSTADKQEILGHIIKSLNELAGSEIVSIKLVELTVPISSIFDRWIDVFPFDSLNKKEVNQFFLCFEDFIVSRISNASEYYTPNDVVELLSEIISTPNKTSIYDPFCRTGNLLNAVASKLNVKQKIGVSHSVSAYQMAKVWSLMLQDEAVLNFGLSNLVHINKGFDLVITNPPFSALIPIKDEGLLAHEFSDGKSDILFLAHSIDSLSNNGICVIILPLSILYGSGLQQKMRKYLIDQNLLDSIIVLPHKLFFGTGIQTVVFLLRKRKKNDKVLLYDATNLGNKGRTKNTLRMDDINIISNATKRFHLGKVKELENCLVISNEQIKKNSYDLRFASYQMNNLTPILRSSKELFSECAEIEKKLLGIQDELRLIR